MRTKTKYRQNNIPVEDKLPDPEPNIPQVEIDGKEPESIAALSIEVPPGEKIDTEAVEEALQEAVVADEAAEALKRQIEAIRHNEQMQRQPKAAVDPRLLPLEDKITLWRANGLSDAEADFIRQNPEVANFPEISNHAAALALQEGHERDSQSYFSAVKNIFDEHMRQMQAQAASSQVPEFFRAPPPKQPAPRTPANYVSAPVSRDVPDGTPRELNPSQVRLTAEEVEHARVAGVDLKTYARHKIELERQKLAGMRQNG